MGWTRRSVVAATAGSFGLAGCLTDDGGGGFEEDEQAEEDPFEDLTDAERSFVDRLAVDRSVESATSDDSELRIEIQTGGDTAEDRRTVAEVYVNFANQLTTDLRVNTVDRGLRQATFSIELSWAQEFADGEIDADMYLERIAETTEA